MIYTSTLTSKGQATIPAPIREKLGILSGQKVVFDVTNGEVVIKNQAKLIDELYGSLKTNIKWNKGRAYGAVGKMLAANYLKTLPKKYWPKVK